MEKSSPWSDVKDATPEIQTICDQVRQNVEYKVRRQCPSYDARFYRVQGVATMRYSIKIYVGNTEYAHLHVMMKPERQAQFIEVLHPKNEEDPLEIF